jgi:hypothetical protein
MDPFLTRRAAAVRFFLMFDLTSEISSDMEERLFCFWLHPAWMTPVEIHYRPFSSPPIPEIALRLFYQPGNSKTDGTQSWKLDIKKPRTSESGTTGRQHEATTPR